MDMIDTKGIKAGVFIAALCLIGAYFLTESKLNSEISSFKYENVKKIVLEYPELKPIAKEKAKDGMITEKEYGELIKKMHQLKKEDVLKVIEK